MNTTSVKPAKTSVSAAGVFAFVEHAMTLWSKPFERSRLPAHLKPEHAGRPTEYRPEYCREVIERMGEGLTLTAFAGSILVARDTVYGWIEAHPEFSDAVARAKAARVLWLEKKLLRSRKGAETTAAIFALRNAAPHEWKDVKYQQVQAVFNPRQLTMDQLRSIAAGAKPEDVGVVIDGEATRLDER